MPSFQTTNILVTGTNGGLGLGICLRFIDDFLATREPAEVLNIIFTTRSSKKGTDTLRILVEHLDRRPPNDHERITFQPENVELTNLLSVRALSRKLISSDLTHLDAVVCNAGIGGWTGLDWPLAIWEMLKDIRSATTWPTYKLGNVGALTRRQLPDDEKLGPEAPLGELFCANLFGHYMLVRYLMPLLRACRSETPAKIIWVSSLEPQAHSYDENDFQGLRSSAAYEHGKRMTDLLALTAERLETRDSVTQFTTLNTALMVPKPKIKRQDLSTPTTLLFHPGIVVTSVFILNAVLSMFWPVLSYFVRLLGSPWATIKPYTAAHGATWLALSSQKVINQKALDATHSTTTSVEKIKWGTAVDRLGNSTVRPTEVEGWGINGSGQPYHSNWWGGKLGRVAGGKEATKEDVDEFVTQGAKVWERLERMRVEWERRIDSYEKSQEHDEPT